MLKDDYDDENEIYVPNKITWDDDYMNNVKTLMLIAHLMNYSSCSISLLKVILLLIT